jgi:SET domain-containing protein
MNHSDTPNTDFSAFGGGTACRDIAAGEELTCNYHQFYEGFELHPRPEPALAEVAGG